MIEIGARQAVYTGKSRHCYTSNKYDSFLTSSHEAYSPIPGALAMPFTKLIKLVANPCFWYT